MKAYKKVYGVKDMTHWNAVITTGNGHNTMRIEFTGGAATANGAKPATFTTENPVVQALIESSDYFKRGKITLYRKYELSTPLKVLVAQKKEEEKEVVGEEKEVVTPLANAEGKEKTAVNVANLEEEGRNYLCEHFGYKPSNLRSKSAIIQCANKHNITFVLPTD